MVKQHRWIKALLAGLMLAGAQGCDDDEGGLGASLGYEQTDLKNVDPTPVYSSSGDGCWATSVADESAEHSWWRAGVPAVYPDGSTVVTGLMGHEPDGLGPDPALPFFEERYGFVLRFDPAGVVQWSGRFRGQPEQVLPSPDGGAVVITHFFPLDPDWFVTWSESAAYPKGWFDQYHTITKFSSDGELLWSTAIQQAIVVTFSYGDHGRAGLLVPQVLSDGSVLIAGAFSKQCIFEDRGADTSLDSGGLVLGSYLARYAPDGSLSWVKQMADPMAPVGLSVTPDGNFTVFGLPGDTQTPEPLNFLTQTFNADGALLSKQMLTQSIKTIRHNGDIEEQSAIDGLQLILDEIQATTRPDGTVIVLLGRTSPLRIEDESGAQFDVQNISDAFDETPTMGHYALGFRPGEGMLFGRNLMEYEKTENEWANVHQVAFDADGGLVALRHGTGETTLDPEAGGPSLFGAVIARYNTDGALDWFEKIGDESETFAVHNQSAADSRTVFASGEFFGTVHFNLGNNETATLDATKNNNLFFIKLCH
jgi:hypothetical protein